MKKVITVVVAVLSAVMLFSFSASAETVKVTTIPMTELKPVITSAVGNSGAQAIQGQYIAVWYPNSGWYNIEIGYVLDKPFRIKQGRRYEINCSINVAHHGGALGNNTMYSSAVKIGNQFTMKSYLTGWNFSGNYTSNFDMNDFSSGEFDKLEFNLRWSVATPGEYNLIYIDDIVITEYLTDANIMEDAIDRQTDEILNAPFDSPRPGLQDDVNNQNDKLKQQQQDALGGKSDDEIKAEVDKIAEFDMDSLDGNASGKIKTFIDDVLNVLGAEYMTLILFSCSIGLAIYIIGKRRGT